MSKLSSWPCFALLILLLTNHLHAQPSVPISGAMQAGEPEMILRKAKDSILHFDDRSLDGYVYELKRTREQLGKHNEVKETEVKLYEVYHLGDKPYRKLLSENGVPVSAERLRKEDQVIAKRIRDNKSRRGWSPFRKDMWADIFDSYDFTFIARDALHGRSVVRFQFRPRKDAKPRTSYFKAVHNKTEGELWLDEAEFLPTRATFRFVDNAGVGLGLWAKVYKGTDILLDWKKVNNEAWLPSRSENWFRMKVFLFTKGFHWHEVEEYSNYRKFSVTTDTKFELPVRKD